MHCGFTELCVRSLTHFGDSFDIVDIFANRRIAVKKLSAVLKSVPVCL